MTEPRTLEGIDEYARLLRKEKANHPLAETLEGCAAGWRRDVGELLAVLKSAAHVLPLGEEYDRVVDAIKRYEGVASRSTSISPSNDID